MNGIDHCDTSVSGKAEDEVTVISLTSCVVTIQIDTDLCMEDMFNIPPKDFEKSSIAAFTCNVRTSSELDPAIYSRGYADIGADHRVVDRISYIRSPQLRHTFVPRVICAITHSCLS
jgi:hypothetical protein